MPGPAFNKGNGLSKNDVTLTNLLGTHVIHGHGLNVRLVRPKEKDEK